VPTLFWDASGLAKRYTAEIGSDVADALFAAVPATAMLTTVWGYAETFSILLRGLNGGRLDQATFQTAFAALRREIIGSPDIGFLTVDEAAVLAGLWARRPAFWLLPTNALSARQVPKDC